MQSFLENYFVLLHCKYISCNYRLFESNFHDTEEHTKFIIDNWISWYTKK